MHIGLCYAEPLSDPGSYGLRSPGRAAEKKFLSSFYLVL